MKKPSLFFWGIFFIIMALLEFGRGGLKIGLLMLIPGLLLLIFWSSKNISFLCPKCGHVFNISFVKFLISPNFAFAKWLKCPKCNQSSLCQKVKKTENKDTEE